ncbi:MAG: beta-galactosidase [Phycisphaerales bacterium]|nr:beta-galactosidase [Phycisphaerales bacterium]
MASITYDGHSFMLDGRRIWLVSGSINYVRVPRAQWAERIAAAKHAGLNTIELPLIWARHEPRQGHFDFQNDNDIRYLVQLIHKAGMHVFLRAGPYVDAKWDMGGLPPWLLGLNAAQGGIRLRTNQNVFLDACSRYITALAGQLRDLQVTSPTKGGASGGPILLMQTETGWTCGDDALASSYLLEIDRYFREAGFSVPLVNSNDLWQSVEGEIDGWTGFDGLLGHLRQLASIRPTSPRLVTQFRIGRTRIWGSAAEPAHTPGVVQARLTEVLAAGGQFNIDPFFGGTNLGFSGGRDERSAESFVCASFDNGAPLCETGRPGECYHAVRRVSTFANRFSRLLAHLDQSRHTVAVAPGSAVSSRPSVVHCTGSQGSVAFVFGGADQAEGAKSEPLSLLLPDGSALPVDLAGQSSAWCLLDTRLTARAQLDYCNLSAFALVGKVFVCFGAEGVRGHMSINGSPLEVTVPGGKEPLVHEHEGIVVVIASARQLETIAVDDHAVYIGVETIDASGHPHAPADAKHFTRIDTDGQSKQHKVAVGASHGAAHGGAHKGSPRKPALDEWTCANVAGYTSGSSARYASIKAPADLVSLGAPYGYGWYRAKFSSSSPRRVKVMFPQSAHRLHVSLDGEPAGVVGVGAGATPQAALSLKKGSHTLVLLAENLGRVSAGADLGEQTGLWGHAWCVEHLSIGKPKLVASEPVDILNFRAPLWRVHRDDMTDPMRLTWAIQHRRKTPVIMSIAPFESSGGTANGGIVLLDGRPISYFPTGAARTIVFDAEQLGRGKNEIQISMIGSTENEAAALAKAVSFDEGVDCLTGKAEWSFAKWDQPGAEAYHKAQRAEGHHGPLWWKSHFHTGESDAPLFFEAAGLSKGQIYLNGTHVGRFWVSTAAGKKVPPQSRYLLPRPMLRHGDEPNDLVVFDEHGFAPTRCRLVADSGVRALD